MEGDRIDLLAQDSADASESSSDSDSEGVEILPNANPKHVSFAPLRHQVDGDDADEDRVERATDRDPTPDAGS